MATTIKLTDLPLDIWPNIVRRLKIEDVCRVVQVCKDLCEKSAYLFHLKVKSLGIHQVDMDLAQYQIEMIGSYIYQNCFKPIVKVLGAERIFLLPRDDLTTDDTKIGELLTSERGPIFISENNKTVAFCCRNHNLQSPVVLFIPQEDPPFFVVPGGRLPPVVLDSDTPIQELVTQLISGEQVRLRSADGNSELLELVNFYER
jgi:hypothetical protein